MLTVNNIVQSLRLSKFGESKSNSEQNKGYSRVDLRKESEMLTKEQKEKYLRDHIKGRKAA